MEGLVLRYLATPLPYKKPRLNPDLAGALLFVPKLQNTSSCGRHSFY